MDDATTSGFVQDDTIPATVGQCWEWWEDADDGEQADAAGDSRGAAAGAAGASLGLSTDHIRPEALAASRRHILTVAEGGTVVKLRGRLGPAGCGKRKAGQPRGRVREFSKRSRSRLLQTVGAINRDALTVKRPLFMTLTYPEVWPEQPETWKAHLRAICKRIRRQYPHAAILWRLEPQERGAPHFHLLVFNVYFVPYKKLAKWWYEVVDSGDERHLGAGTNVTRIRSWRGVMSYASKYLAKDGKGTGEFAGGCVGRWWGVDGRQFLPVRWLHAVLDNGEFFRARRTVRRLQDARSRARGSDRKWRCKGTLSGCWLFLPAAQGRRLAPEGLRWLDQTAEREAQRIFRAYQVAYLAGDLDGMAAASSSGPVGERVSELVAEWVEWRGER